MQNSIQLQQLGFYKISNTLLRSFLLIIIGLLYAHAGISQQSDSTFTADSSASNVPAKEPITVIMQRIGTAEAQKGVEKFASQKITMQQIELLDELRSISQAAKGYIRKRIDSTYVADRLQSADAQMQLATKGIDSSSNQVLAQRNLAVSATAFKEILRQLEHLKEDVYDDVETLIKFRYQIDSINSIAALYTFPSDSTEAMRYFKRLVVLAKEIGATDTAIDRALVSALVLRTSVEEEIYRIGSFLEETDGLRSQFTSNIWQQEFNNFPGTSEQSFSSILHLSYVKEKMALGYYVQNNWSLFVIMAIMIAFITYLLYTLRLRFEVQHTLLDNPEMQVVIRYPFLSALVIVPSIFQFSFIDPPFIVEYIIWLIAAIALTLLLYKEITAYWFRIWIYMIVFMLLSGCSNMILVPHPADQWLMLAIAITGAAIAVYAIANGKRQQLKEKRILYFIGFVIVIELVAAGLLVSGRYNLSKMLLISGFSGVVVAILFLWTIRLVNSALALTAKTFRHPEKKLLYINFEKIGNRVPGIFYVLLVIGWFVLVARNFYAYKLLASPFNDFLNTERNLGDYTFSINGIFIFLVILLTSFLLSRLVSFFASEPEAFDNPDNRKKVGLGSWLLLIRIVIISAGLFLAFAAAGIPLDKITIILGALGVGIGLGLQDLVKNLVSGLVLAFEKPVNVGDWIEVNGKPGTMKSIGFRSSVVAMIDGPHLVVPNGDLLSLHLINWTANKNLRRLSVSVGVAYGTDLAVAKQIIKDILYNDDRILKHLPQLALPKEFSNNAVVIDTFFWVNNVKEWMGIRSDVVVAIHSAFREAGIVIPFNQIDLHLTTDNAILPSSNTPSPKKP